MISDLFEPEPHQWGLRGDPYLWREMRVHFAETPIPATVEELVREIESAFLLLAGSALSTNENFRVERFAHGGMSSGGVCPEFWRKRALPLLRERFLKKTGR
jgi:molybdenum cofactor cytidylyltransferase